MLSTKVKQETVIEIWSEVSSLRDPTAHWWTGVDREVPIRICDGEERPDSPRPSVAPTVTCSVCVDIYVNDLAYGGKRFQPLSFTPRRHRRRRANTGDTIANQIGTTHFRGGATTETPYTGFTRHEDSYLPPPPIPLTSFVEFHATTPAKRASIVRTLRSRYYNPNEYVHRDYYLIVRNLMRKTHGDTHVTASVEDAYINIKRGKFDDRKSQNLKYAAECYIALCGRRCESTFNVPNETVEFRGLGLRVSADIGIRDKNGDHLALKLWFTKPKPPSQTYRRAFHHLLDLLAPDSWEEHWEPRIWDVHRKEILPWTKPTKDIDVNLASDAAAFQVMWDEFGRIEDIDAWPW